MKKTAMPDPEKDQADYKRLFEESPIPMWIYNSITLTFMNVNAAAIQYYGYTKEEFLAMQVPDLRTKDDANTTSEIIKMPSLNSFYDSGRRMHIKKNGERFFAQVYSHPTFFGGKIARVMLAMDINNKVLIEQKNAELHELIHHQKARLDEILSSVSEVVWSARADNFEILYINPACINVYGYAPSELIGDTRKLFENVHSADIGIVKNGWDSLLATGKAVFEYRVYHRDGSLKYILNQAVLKQRTHGEPSVIHGIAVDVTRLRVFEEKLHDKVADIENILESITDGFFAVDRNWNYTYINKEFERILLRRREDLLGKNIWENFPQVEGLKFYTEQHRAVAEHISVHFDEYIPVLRRWFTVNAYPTKDGLTVYLRDISEEKKQSIKIQTQHDKLRDIAWIQSHKVRGPLATILGLVDLFNTEDATDPSNKDIIENLADAAKALDAVVKEIVDKTTLDG